MSDGAGWSWWTARGSVPWSNDGFPEFDDWQRFVLSLFASPDVLVDGPTDYACADNFSSAASDWTPDAASSRRLQTAREHSET